MKHKVAVNRWSRRITKSHKSLTVTIPHDVVKQWEVREGQEVVVYQLDGALLVIPLERLLTLGEPALLRPLTKILDLQSSKNKSVSSIGDSETNGSLVKPS